MKTKTPKWIPIIEYGVQEHLKAAGDVREDEGPKRQSYRRAHILLANFLEAGQAYQSAPTPGKAKALLAAAAKLENLRISQL